MIHSRLFLGVAAGEPLHALVRPAPYASQGERLRIRADLVASDGDLARVSSCTEVDDVRLSSASSREARAA